MTLTPEEREALIARLAEDDYNVNWSDKSYVIEYLKNEVYGPMSDDELITATEQVSLGEDKEE